MLCRKEGHSFDGQNNPGSLPTVVGAQWNNPYFVPSRPPDRFIFGESVTSQASILISIHYEFVTNILPAFNSNFAADENKTL